MNKKIVSLVVDEFVKLVSLTSKNRYQALCVEFDREEGEFEFCIKEVVAGEHEEDVFPVWIYKGGNKLPPVGVIKNRVLEALNELEPASDDLLGEWGRSVFEKWEGKWGGVA